MEWSRPRQTPMAGRRKPTHRWCQDCEALHRTHRHAQGEELCPMVEMRREERRAAMFAAPLVAKPRPERQRVRMKVGGVIEA